MADHTLCVSSKVPYKNRKETLRPAPAKVGQVFHPIIKKGLRKNEILLQLVCGIPCSDQRSERCPRGMDSAHRR